MIRRSEQCSCGSGILDGGNSKYEDPEIGTRLVHLRKSKKPWVCKRMSNKKCDQKGSTTRVLDIFYSKWHSKSLEAFGQRN